MITASDIRKLLESYDSRVDEIIEDEIKPLFLNECSCEVKIKEDDVNRIHRMTKAHFINQMRKRGFGIEHSSTQKPFSEPFYTIALPPRDE